VLLQHEQPDHAADEGKSTHDKQGHAEAVMRVNTAAEPGCNAAAPAWHSPCAALVDALCPPIVYPE
jgi:hypothetical protein